MSICAESSPTRFSIFDWSASAMTDCRCFAPSVACCSSLFAFNAKKANTPSNGCKRQQHDEHDNQDARVTASTLDTADVLGAHPPADPPTMRLAVLGILIGIS